jgi:hydrogenase-4 component B
MGILNVFIIVILISVIVIILLPSGQKSLAALFAVGVLCILSSIPAIDALKGINTEIFLRGSFVTGTIPVKIDALSAWFILTINFTFLTGILYGMNYIKAYPEKKTDLSMHWVAYILTHSALIAICAIQNGIAFLIAWEIMAISAFIMVIFEHHKQQTLKAGINYLIQSHICILFLSFGFIWIIYKTHSCNFDAISLFSISTNKTGNLILFFCFFTGFAIKAGFVPLHTWLPYAHPAAPAHVSGVMSGVIIKIGIYGILRMLTYVNSDITTIGYIILFLSVITGIYGVILAILQHNLKKLLAYHSIENIGIIGIGIGLGCIGIGSGNAAIATLGFTGALLHTLNHSLFKSLLFFASGNVYQSAHTMNIEQLGGIGRRIPHTAILFLIAALAICGLPPFNGFISEFLIYTGLFNGLKGENLTYLLLIISSVFGLSLIGGLALLCFTKAFGSIFLGTPRHKLQNTTNGENFKKLIPMYAITFFIIAIGVFPKFALDVLKTPVGLLTAPLNKSILSTEVPGISSMTSVGYSSLAFLVLSCIVFILRMGYFKIKPVRTETTWGCGYIGPNNKMQYSASSFVRNFRKLAEPMLSIHKFKKDVEGIFPGPAWHETHPKDKSEEMLIKFPIRKFRTFLNMFSFLQNGRPQIYILYGFTFIVLVISVPEIFNILRMFFQFLHNL